MKNNYDKIAGSYDMLSRLVFFRTQLKAQIDQLHFIPAGSNILIAGGGTGWILEEIAKQHPAGLNITYVELSAKMLELSRKRDVKENKVTYIHAAAEDFHPEVKYDVILTAFFFDNFSAEGVKAVFNQFDLLLKKDGLWLFTDFYYAESSGKNWQWYLLKAMYLFFNRISKVEAKMLINTEKYFEEQLYLQLNSVYYYSGFIKAITYQKII